MCDAYCSVSGVNERRLDIAKLVLILRLRMHGVAVVGGYGRMWRGL